MRKKVDSRIKTLIENCQKLKQRGIFVIIGDRGRDQVVNLHYLMTKMNMIQRIYNLVIMVQWSRQNQMLILSIQMLRDLI